MSTLYIYFANFKLENLMDISFYLWRLKLEMFWNATQLTNFQTDFNRILYKSWNFNDFWRSEDFKLLIDFVLFDFGLLLFIDYFVLMIEHRLNNS